MDVPLGDSVIPTLPHGETIESSMNAPVTTYHDSLQFDMTQVADAVVGEGQLEPSYGEDVQQYGATYEEQFPIQSYPFEQTTANVGPSLQATTPMQHQTGIQPFGPEEDGIYDETETRKKQEKQARKEAKRKRREDREERKDMEKKKSRDRGRDRGRNSLPLDGATAEDAQNLVPTPVNAEDEGDRDFIDDTGVPNDVLDPDDTIGVEGGIDSADESRSPKHNPFDDVLAKLRNRRKRRNHESVKEEDVKAHVQDVLATMRAAAEADRESFRNSQPGVAKLQLVDQVVKEISQPKFSRWYTQRKLLDVLAFWLEPLQDSPLVMPNVTIRNKVLQLLQRLPVVREDIGTEIGPRLIQMWKCPEETEDNRFLIRNLVEKWMRPVLNLRSSYKQGQPHAPDEAIEVPDISQPSRSANYVDQRGKTSYEPHMTPAYVMDETPVDQENAKRRHAKIPTRTGYNFKILPPSDYDGQDVRRTQGRVKSVINSSRRNAPRPQMKD